MPGGDRTGPLGEGSMTGRRLGFCAANDEPGAYYGRAYGSGRGPGMAFRRGLRGGYGRRLMWQSVPLSANETNTQNDEKHLRGEIEDLRDQLSFLENKLSKLKQ